MTLVRGKREDAVREDCARLVRAEVRPFVYPPWRRGRAPIAARPRRRRSSPAPRATWPSRSAADLGIEHLLVTQLVVRDGLFTGEAVRPVCYGRGKVYWAERFAERTG